MQPWLRPALRCPRCRGELADVPAAAAPAAGADGALACTGACRCTYPVVDGVPVLLADEGRPPATPAGGGTP